MLGWGHCCQSHARRGAVHVFHAAWSDALIFRFNLPLACAGGPRLCGTPLLTPTRVGWEQGLRMETAAAHQPALHKMHAPLQLHLWLHSPAAQIDG